MADSTNPATLFKRGKTHYDGLTIDSSDWGNSLGLEGRTGYFKDEDPTDRAKLRSGEAVKAICVRNVSGIALAPGRTVAWKAGYRGRRVDGYTRTTNAEAAGVVDEHLPTAGVPNNDLFWLTVDGPSLVYTDLTGDAGTSFAEGDVLVAITAANSTAHTGAGRIRDADFVVTEAVLAAAIMNRIGRAMSANTTGQTNRAVLVRVNILP